MRDRHTPDKMDAWARLQRASGVVLSRVETRLKADGFPPLGWYDVLLELQRSEGMALRPVEIEKRTLLAQYNVSRMIERIAVAGYVEKRKAAEDARGVMVHLLPYGEDLLKDMWPAYKRAVEAEFSIHLDDDETRILWHMLGKLLP